MRVPAAGCGCRRGEPGACNARPAGRHLKDLTLSGCTFQEEEVFENLVSYVERDEIRPLVAKTFPLHEIRRAQEEFLAKAFTGKLVLIPPE